MSRTTFYSSLKFLLGVVLYNTVATLACSGPSESADMCTPGKVLPCAVASDPCAATKTCKADGTWDRCVCQPSGTGGTSAGSVNDASADAASQGILGNSCVTDNDCVKGAFCLVTTSNRWLGGGPPSALCVADCSADASTCDGFSDAVCVTSSVNDQSGSGPALCFPSCNIGQGTLTAPTCANAAHQACEALDTTGSIGFCSTFLPIRLGLQQQLLRSKSGRL